MCDAHLIEFGLYRVVAGQLPAAIRSPVATIEEQDLIRRREICWYRDLAAVDQVERHSRELGSRVQFLHHGILTSRRRSGVSRPGGRSHEGNAMLATASSRFLPCGVAMRLLSR